MLVASVSSVLLSPWAILAFVLVVLAAIGWMVFSSGINHDQDDMRLDATCLCNHSVMDHAIAGGCVRCACRWFSPADIDEVTA